MRTVTMCLLGWAVLFAAGGASSEVTKSSPQAFDIALEATVTKDADAVWDALIEDTGNWWLPEGTLSGDPMNVTLEAWAGGCICEALDDGGSVKQLEVILVSRDAGILQAIGGFGPLRAVPVSGIFTLTITANDAGGTRIGMTYRVSGGGEVEALAAQVDQLLVQQLARLAHWIDHGMPTPAL